MPQTKVQKRQQSNGSAPTKTARGTLEEAVAHEAALAEEAAEIRGAETELDPVLFLKLWPLLRRPIPDGFVISTPAVTGKPYASDGVKSVQVLIDRMDLVLTPLKSWWDYDCVYSEGGVAAHVRVWVGPEDAPFVRRSSMGGVDRGSTRGNVLKGSFTNAAKLAFARVGPGHEIYVGVVDLDPDVNKATAKAQERPEPAPQKHAGPQRTWEQSAALDDAIALAKDVVEAKVWTRKSLMTRLVAAGATDTASITAAMQSLSPHGVEELRSTMADLLAAKQEGL